MNNSDTMSKITAIIASPRKNGNCVAIVDKISETAKAAGNDVEIFYLNQLDAKGCQACMACKKGTGICIRKDGLTPVLESVKAADSLVIAVPDYFGQAASQYRVFEDRMYGFIDGSFKCSFAPGKKLAVIVTSGSGAGAPETEAMIEKVMANYFKLEPVGSIVFSEAKSGPAKDSAETMAAAEELAKKL